MNDNRRRLIDLIRILHTKTDEDHCLDTYQLLDELEALGHDRPDRKTIEPNIRFLVDDLGYSIEKDKGTPNRYRWLDREFELAELKMLVDAVQSSRFISDNKSREIIEKLKKLTSKYQAEKLDRNIVTNNSFKRDHSAALYSIDEINAAIRNHKRVHFQMADYNLDKKEALRYDGKEHEASPYALIWNNDYYYMLGMPADGDKVRTYRIDRMRNTICTDIPADKCPADFNLEKYSGRVFDMFSGETSELTLECKSYVINYLIDRFGRDFIVRERGLVDEDGDERFVADVTVDTSPTFYAWVFQFGGDIKILGPEKAYNEFQALIDKQLY